MKQEESARHMNNWEQHAELSKKISICRNSDLGRKCSELDFLCRKQYSKDGYKFITKDKNKEKPSFFYFGL
jgi:hypothetical protein